MSKKAIVLSLLSVIGFPAAASAHSMFPAADDINPETRQVDRGNAKLNFLEARGRAAGLAPSELQAARAIFNDKYRWKKLRLEVCFWNGSEEEQRDIMQVANAWHDAVPSLTFEFEREGKVRICQLGDLSNPHNMADIRINLNPNDPRAIWNKDDDHNGDWSYIGFSASTDKTRPTTMSLVVAVGEMTRQPLDYDFNVRHEFGHALGLVHEHQRSICNGWFDIDQIAADTHWSVQYAAAQVGALGDTSNIDVIGAYDKNSIMQYNFDINWYKPDRPGMPNPCRREDHVDDLSAGDKFAIAQIYDPSLNQTAERKGLIESYRARASATASNTPVSAAGPPLGAGSKASIEAALAAFKANIGLPEKISIQLFLKPGDRDIVLKAVSNLGYPVTDASGNRIITQGHPLASLLKDPTNAIWFTKDVSQEDVRFIAASLLGAGIEIRSIDVYQPSDKNGFAKRTDVVQLGSSRWNRDRKTLTQYEIMNHPLPMFGATSR